MAEYKLFRAGLTRREFLKGVGVGLGVLTVGVATGCKIGAPAAEGEKPLIGFCLHHTTVPRFLEADVPNCQKTVEELGGKLIYVEAASDPGVQQSQVEDMITKKVDCLILIPVNDEAGKTAAKLVKEAGIPLLIYNNILVDAPQDYVVARDNVVLGENLGNQALKDVGPKGNYVVVSGTEGDSVSRWKTEGVFNILQPYIDKGDITLVSHQWHQGWATDLAQKQAEDALTATNNNVQAFVSIADCMAYGIVAALDDQGLAGKVWVSGEDVEEAMLKLMAEGKVNASVWTEFDKMGVAAGKAAMALARGEKPEYEKTFNTGIAEVPWFLAPQLVVTPANMVEFVRTHIWWVKASKIWKDVPKEKWPSGVEELIAAEEES